MSQMIEMIWNRILICVELNFYTNADATVIDPATM
jgi:hypothetical protein